VVIIVRLRIYPQGYVTRLHVGRGFGYLGPVMGRSTKMGSTTPTRSRTMDFTYRTETDLSYETRWRG
jgi:hypothetical protein